MHVLVGAILVLVGAGAVAYVARGAAAFDSEPPFLAVGVLFTGVFVHVSAHDSGVVCLDLLIERPAPRPDCTRAIRCAEAVVAHAPPAWSGALESGRPCS